MLIEQRDLKDIASGFLKGLNENCLDDLLSLDKLMDTEFKLERDKFIQISLRPSNRGTMAHTVSYVMPGTGAPIEFKINRNLEYSQILLKCQHPVGHYQIFAQDPFGNLVQANILQSYDVKSCKKELESLAK